MDEAIHNRMKIGSIRYGDARVFGEDSDVRRELSDDECLERAYEREKLAIEVERAPAITREEAEEGLESHLESSKKTDVSARGGAKSGAVNPASADHPSLGRVIGAWPSLTDAARKAILGIVRIDRKKGGR